MFEYSLKHVLLYRNNACTLHVISIKVCYIKHVELKDVQNISPQNTLYFLHIPTKAYDIKQVFKYFLNISRDGVVLIERGSLFHSRGSATTKDLSAHNCLNLVQLTSSFHQTVDSCKACRNSTS